jgi:hypothetical protein
MLVWPAGRAVAILVVLVMHLLLGPYAAGQRDYLMSIPGLAAALASVRAGEDRRHRRLDLLLAGAFAVTAAAIKPSGVLLLGLPFLAMGGSTRREAVWVAAGAAGTGLLGLGILAAYGSLWPFIAMIDGTPRWIRARCPTSSGTPSCTWPRRWGSRLPPP